MGIFKQTESQVRSYCRSFDVTFTSAKGCYLTDQDGNQYLDFLAGAGSLNYGHNHDALKGALLEYIERDGVTHGLDMHTDAKGAFLEAFQKHIMEPRKLNHKVMFTGPTGTNAVEAAIKLARKVKGRDSMVAFTNGFHGVTQGALALTGNQHHRQGAGVTLTNVFRLPYEGYGEIDGLAYFEQMLNDNSAGMDKPAGVILETVQGEGGLNVASNEWLQKLEKLCRQHDILLIIDDIQAGCGRTGTFFSFEPSGIKPDMITLSKSLSGYGLPMAVVLIKPELDQWVPGEHNGTFRGNNHAFTTARMAIETFWADDSFQKEIQRKAKHIHRRLNEMVLSHDKKLFSVKGRGLMQGLDCQSGELAGAISQAAFERGMIIECGGPDDEVLKCLCPLIISDADLDKGLDILDQAISQVELGKYRKAS